MEQAEAMVGAFRGIVDGIIYDQVNHARLRWLGMGQMVVANGLEFISVDQTEGRYQHIPHSPERVWAVAPNETLSYAGHRGFAAIVSFAHEDATLFRNWSFKSAKQFLDVSTMRPITTDEEMASILQWVRAPHINKDVLQSVLELTADEAQTVETQLEEYAKQQAALSPSCKYT